MEEHIRRGWATRSDCTTESQLKVVSIAYKEGHQSRTSELPVGARSLLLAHDTHAMVLRGLNKFVEFDWGSHTALLTKLLEGSTETRFVLQRKLAGFVVHLFSLDGMHLEVMSKHSLDGRHVTEARRILQATLSADEMTRLARSLYCDSLVASGECVSPVWDATHPVIEGGEARIEFFAVGSRCNRAEMTWLSTMAAAWCASHSLLFVQQEFIPARCIIAKLEEVERRTQQWATASEGFVLVVEVPTQVVDAAAPAAALCVVPLRFKLKTIRYRVLRCLRSHILGEHILSPQHPFYQHPYMTMFVRWVMELQDSPLTNAAEIAAHVRNIGVWKWSNDFEEALARLGKKRKRNEAGRNETDAPSTSPDALQELIHVVECAASPQRTLHSAVLLCGIPGAGKSTVAKALVSCSDRTVVHISRDTIAAHVTRSLQQSSGGPPSNHQLRRLKKAIHDAYCQRIAEVTRWLVFQQEPVLVVLDACHASRASRETFREIMPSTLRSCICVHMSLGDDGPLCAVARVASRVNHEVLSPADAEKAVLDVSRVFEAPLAATERHFDQVLTVVSSTTSPEGGAELIADALLMDRTGPSRTQHRVIHSLEDIVINYAALLPLCTSMVGADAWTEGLSCMNAMQLTAPVSLRLVPALPLDKATLWTFVAQLIAKASSPTSREQSAVVNDRSLFSRLASWWSGGQSQSTAPEARVGGGHLMWLPGVFLQRDRTDPVAPSEVPALVAAMRARYENDLATDQRDDIHVTLHYLKGRNATANAEALRASLISRHNGPYQVAVTGVVLDSRGVCLTVAVEPNLISDHNLHITLGHTHHVKAAYSLELLQQAQVTEAKKRHNYCHLIVASSPLLINMQLDLVQCRW